MSISFTPHVLDRHGCPLHYWVGGAQDAPLVVFTHGAGVDHHTFDPHLPVVAQRYRVLTWDVRGHGQSRPMGQTFSLPLAADDLLALMDAQGYQQAVLVGHSNGTYISQEVAFRQPARVRALVVADGTCITWQRSALDNWLVSVSGDVMALMPYELLKKSGLAAMSANKAIQDYAYRAYSAIPKADFIAIWKGMTASLHAEPHYRISQPLLLMHGDGDTLGDIRRVAPAWAKREPNCEYVVIPNARHFAPLEQPEFFLRQLMAFLEQWAG